MTPLEICSCWSFPSETPIALLLGGLLGYLTARIEDHIRRRRAARTSEGD